MYLPSEFDGMREAYWSHPEVIYTYAHGKPGSQLLKINVFEIATLYLREQIDGTLTLIHWAGQKTDEAWDEAVRQLRGCRLNLLPALYYPPAANAYEQVTMWESTHAVLDAPRWYKRAKRKFSFVPVPKDASGVEHMMKLLRRWSEIDRGREVVGIGHYECVIKTYPLIESAQTFACVDYNGEYRAMIGGYVADGKAVAVNGKHDYSDAMLAQGMWAHWLDWVHGQGISVCHAGDTSDKLKGSLGMMPKVLAARGAYELIT